MNTQKVLDVNKTIEWQDWIDVAKGIGIISMLIAHDFLKTQRVIFAFHMPLFLLLAGYTIKEPKRDTLWNSTIKDFKRLILPCVVARFIILGLNCLLENANLIMEMKDMVLCLLWGNHHGTLLGYEPPSIGRIWFLNALFWSKGLYRLFMLWFHAKFRLLILLPLSLFSIFLGQNEWILPQNFDMIFLCILFMEIGARMRKIDFHDLKWWIVMGLFAVWMFYSISEVEIFSLNARNYPGNGVCIGMAIIANICIFKWSHVLEHSRIAKPLIFMGKHSLILLVVESITPNYYRGTTVSQKLISILIECIICIVCVKISQTILPFLKKTWYNRTHIRDKEEK